MIWKYISLIAGAAVVGAVVAAGAFLTFSETPTPSGPFEARADIEGLFAELDAPRAYTSFVERNRLSSPSVQHGNAHVAGEALYRNAGFEGFALCSSDFGFGCYHSFIPLALAEYGDEVVRELDDACIAAYGELGLGCSHGLGHGALAYYGYDEDAIAKALGLCAGLTWQHPYGGCQDGAFMEYNDRTMEPEAQLRPLDEKRRHEPCASLPARFRESCYFSQSGWWEKALADGPDERQKLGRWCAEAREDSARACFRGLGYAFAPLTGFTAARGIDKCDALPLTHNQSQWCREGLAWALYADPATRAEAEKACTEGLDETHAADCLQNYLFTIQ